MTATLLPEGHPPTPPFRAYVHEWCGMVDDLDAHRCPCFAGPATPPPTARKRPPLRSRGVALRARRAPEGRR